jgi:hypothetical protein
MSLPPRKMAFIESPCCVQVCLLIYPPILINLARSPKSAAKKPGVLFLRCLPELRQVRDERSAAGLFRNGNLRTHCQAKVIPSLTASWRSMLPASPGTPFPPCGLLAPPFPAYS